MDFGKRLAELANIVCAGFLIYDFGDKKKWWDGMAIGGFGEYAFPASLLVALGMNIWALQRKPKLAAPTEHSAHDESSDVEFWRNKFHREESAKMLSAGNLEQLQAQHERMYRQLQEQSSELMNERAGSSARDQIIRNKEAQVANLEFLLGEERGSYDKTKDELNELRNKPTAMAFPNLIVQYWHEGSKPLNEFFEITNYGPGLVQKVVLGSLLISKVKGEESHTVSVTVTPFTGLGVLQERRPERIGFHLSIGNHGTDLVTYIRNNLESGYDTTSKMRIIYEDLEGRVFTRSFAFWIDTHNIVSIEADGPVMLYPASTGGPL